MGYYINPEIGSKYEWLKRFGDEVHHHEVLKEMTENEKGTVIPVCLIDNGIFTAAGICYSQKEFEAFSLEDGRPKKWFIVDMNELKKGVSTSEVQDFPFMW